VLRNYRDLTAWQKACQVCLDVYRISRKLPASEKYGLPSQMRRAAVSVPSNIAEGYSRSSTGDYIRGLRIAYASNSELETQVMLARDLCYLSADDADKLLISVQEVERILKALTKSLARIQAGP